MTVKTVVLFCCQRKTGIALSDKHITICDTCRQRFHLGSRNDFIEEAIEYYQDYLVSGTQVSSLVRDVVDTMNRRLNAYTGKVIENQEEMLRDLGEIRWLLRERNK